MEGIEDIPDDDLRAELRRREDEKLKPEKPKQLEVIDTTELRDICQECLDAIDKSGYINEVTEQYIYEVAMETIFRSSVWVWIKKITDKS